MYVKSKLHISLRGNNFALVVRRGKKEIRKIRYFICQFSAKTLRTNRTINLGRVTINKEHIGVSPAAIAYPIGFRPVSLSKVDRSFVRT